MKYYNLEICLERLAASICKEAEDKSSGGGDELAFGEGNPNDGPVPSAITPLTTKSIQPSPDRSHTTCSQDMEKRELSQCSKEYNGSHSGGAEREGAKSPQMPAQDACSKHRRTVQERYGATFVAFGCICKAMLARGLDTCCTVQSQHSRSSSLRSNTPIPQSGRAKREPIYSLAAPSQNPSNTSLRKGSDGCCLDTTKVQKISGGSCVADKGRCSSTIKTQIAPDDPCAATTDCCSSTAKTQKAPDDSCAATTGGGPGTADTQNISKGTCGLDETDSQERMVFSFSQKHPSTDIELGEVPTEHVVLKVEGLTCVGCETKLFRALDSAPAARNIKTSLMLSRAEFDYKGVGGNIDELISTIERQTGFHCERFQLNAHQTLELIVQGDPQLAIDLPRPQGILDVLHLAEDTICIQYKADIIGARDILDHYSYASPHLAPAKKDSDLVSGKKHVRKTCLTTLISIVLTIPVLVLSWAPLPPHATAYGAVSLAFATLIQVFIAGPFYPSAIKAILFSRVIEMDLLIVLSTTVAYLFSVVSYALEVVGRSLSTGQFFQTSTLLVTLIMVGRSVSAFARQRAVESISIRSMQAITATLANNNGNNERVVDARLQQYGDLFKVLPDTRVVTDGRVISGSSDVDESAMTGESRPIDKSPGSFIIAGSLNGGGVLLVQLTRLPGENTLSEVANMVDEAKFSKAKIQETADRVAGYFVPVIIALTLVVFIIWILIGKLARDNSLAMSVVNAITYAIAVLVVSCPCAIGLAVPMVIVITGGVAAEHGIIFKSAQAIELARKVSHVVLDKTGTLTNGKPSIAVEEYFPSESRPINQSIILGLISNSKHPISSVITGHLREKNAMIPAVLSDVKSITGMGIEGVYDKTAVRGGSPRWLGVEEHPIVQTILAKGLTAFCATVDSELVGAFGLEDTVRTDTLSIISALKSRGLAISIVSGDHPAAVRSVAARLGIEEEKTQAQCLPADKQRFVKTLGDRGDTVLFCGDGTNDFIALAQAAIGVHINEGTDAARSAADVVLMRPSLRGIPMLLDIAKAAHRRIIFNFAWSFIYNVFAILLAGGAFVRARIPPAYAGLGEVVSVLPVVIIALQLKWAQFSDNQ